MSTPLIDSNVAGLSFSEEVSLKVLSGSPTFYSLQPNSYADFGAKYTSVARSTINSSRQQLKGTLTGLDANAGFQSDFVQNGLQRLLQGFFFASMRQKPSTQPFNGTQVVISSLTTTAITLASTVAGILPGSILNLSGFITNNNKPFVLSAVSGATLTTSGLAADAAPGAAAKADVVGFQFATGDATIATSGLVTLSSTVADFTTMGLTIGEWIFIGGDTTVSQFATGAPGYARILTIAPHALVFDMTYLPTFTDSGAGKTIQIFFGNVLRNELATNLIVRRSYTLERTLGQDANGPQAEYILGCIPNEFTLTLGTATKATADFTFVGMDVQENDGLIGLIAGTRPLIANESPFNTSQAIYSQRLYVINPATAMPTALYGYLMDAKIVINNKITPDKALGILGNIEASAGDFEVTSSLTAYFASVDAAAAIRANANVAFNVIMAQNNQGTILDIPLLALGDGTAKVEKDKKISVGLTATGAQNNTGYTALMNFFNYLPNIAL